MSDVLGNSDTTLSKEFIDSFFKKFTQKLENKVLFPPISFLNFQLFEDI